MQSIISQAKLEVKARESGSATRPVTITVRDVSGIPFAAEGDTPHSVASGPVNLSCPETDNDNLLDLLKHDELEISIYINDELAFVGYAEAPYGLSEINLSRTYSLTVKPRIMDRTVDITDARTNGNYPYIFTSEAAALVLNAAGVSADDQVIGRPGLVFNTPVPQVINRATVDLADVDVSYTTSRKVSNTVEIGDYQYIGVGEYVIAYKAYTWYKVARFGSVYEVRALAVDGTDLVCRLFYDDEMFDETITPAPSLDDWTVIERPTATGYRFYADGYEVESFASRWRTYGGIGDDVYWAIQSIGHAPPQSTKEGGVPDIWPRGTGALERNADAGSYTICVAYIYSDPDEIGLSPGNLISITGHNAEHLGEILNVELFSDGIYTYYLVMVEKRTEHFHGAEEAVYFYAPSEYMTPNIVFTRYDKLHIRYENENQIGGRFEIIPPKAIKRIDDSDIINQFYKPVSVETTDKEIDIPYPAWYSFISEGVLEVSTDETFADLPRRFYLDVPVYTPVPRVADWTVKHTIAERYGQADFEMIEYGGTWILTVHGRAEFDGDYVVYEDFLYDVQSNVITNLTFNRWDGSALRMLYRYRKNTDYAGKPEVFLTGNVKYYNGVIYGCGRQVEREFPPLHSRIIGAANPRDANDEVPDDANVKGVTILVLEGDLTDYLESGQAVKVGGYTTHEPGGREFVIIQIDSGYRQFAATRDMARTDISFHHTDDWTGHIQTVDGDFTALFTVDETIRVSGSADNDGSWKIKSVSSHLLGIWSGEMVYEEAGAEITITAVDSGDLVKCKNMDWQFDGEWEGNVDYSGYVTWIMITPTEGEGEGGTVGGGTESMAKRTKAPYCGNYVWFENRRIERAVLIEYDTNEENDPLTLTELTLNTDYEHEAADRQARERAGAVGVEPKLLDDEDWTFGNVYKLEHEPDVSTIEVYRGGIALNVENRSAYNDVPEPALDTCYVVENKGTDRVETWLYVKGEVRAKYDYYPDVEITAIWELDGTVYFADSDGYIYDTAGTEYGNAGGVIESVCETDDAIYYITREGLFGYFGTEPPAVAVDFGGEDTAVSFLGALTRQALTTCYEFAGKIYYATALTAEPSAWALTQVDLDEALAPVAVEINGVRGGDVKAIDGIESLRASYATDALSEVLADKIFEAVENRRKVLLTAKAENPQSILGTVEHRGITYKILGITISGSGTENALALTGEVIGVAGELAGMKVGMTR